MGEERIKRTEIVRVISYTRPAATLLIDDELTVNEWIDEARSNCHMRRPDGFFKA